MPFKRYRVVCTNEHCAYCDSTDSQTCAGMLAAGHNIYPSHRVKVLDSMQDMEEIEINNSPKQIFHTWELKEFKEKE